MRYAAGLLLPFALACHGPKASVAFQARPAQSTAVLPPAAPVAGFSPGIERGHNAVVTQVAFRADGAVIATADDSSVIKVWDIPSARPLLTVRAGHRVHDLAVGNGTLAAVAGGDILGIDDC